MLGSLLPRFKKFTTTQKFKRYFPIFSITLLGFLIYSNTFFGSFHFDDELMLRHPNVANLSDAIKNLTHTRSMGYLSFSLNYFFHSREVLGYHLVNLAIHLTTAILVWQTSLLTFATPVMRKLKSFKHRYWLSLLVALVFVSHPLQTQAVTYIVQRLASLATLFYILTLYCYILARLKKKIIYYLGVVIVGVLAFLTKEITFTLPVAILTYEWFFFHRNKSFFKQAIVGIIFAILMLIYVLSVYDPSYVFSTKIPNTGETVTAWTYFLTQSRVIVKYIQLLLVPIRQNLDYYFPLSHSPMEATTFLSFVFLASVLGLAIKLYKKYRLLSFGIFWFFITLSIESSIIPIKDAIFEHRLYLPMFGFALFLVGSCYQLARIFLGKNYFQKLIFVFSLIIVVYSGLTYRRNLVWRDEITLWTDIVNKAPQNARAHNNLGLALKLAGNFELAKIHYQKAIELDHDYIGPYNNLGNIIALEGDLDSAQDYYKKALIFDPERTEVRTNLGIVLFKDDQFMEAITQFEKVLELEPDHKLAKKNLEITKFKILLEK